jgi:short subunit dehydrogenase-like uncharacterized protein
VAARIVVFGATGYTGRLAAEALVRRGARPVLAARNRPRVEAMAKELGGLESVVADVDQPQTVQAAVHRGDVLVTTVGPFARWGRPAVDAAIAAPATYFDSTGEPSFIRHVFEVDGPRAAAARCALLPGFGYDYVPGNVAGALAVVRGGDRAVRVDVGYFITGSMRGGMSGGTAATSTMAFRAKHFAWRDGRLVSERGGSRVRSFAVAGRRRQAISLGMLEHIALPRLYPQLREVNAYLGWFGPMTRPLQVGAAVGSVVGKLPGVSRGLDRVLPRLVKGSTGGPDEASRAKTGSRVIAVAYDARDEEVATVEMAGVNGYTFTGEILAWGALHAAVHGLERTGALGPVEAFGLDALVQGCADAGLRVV